MEPEVDRLIKGPRVVIKKLSTEQLTKYNVLQNCVRPLHTEPVHGPQEEPNIKSLTNQNVRQTRSKKQCLGLSGNSSNDEGREVDAKMHGAEPAANNFSPISGANSNLQTCGEDMCFELTVNNGLKIKIEPNDLPFLEQQSPFDLGNNGHFEAKVEPVEIDFDECCGSSTEKFSPNRSRLKNKIKPSKNKKKAKRPVLGRSNKHSQPEERIDSLYQCPQCVAVLTTDSRLKMHISKIHESGLYYTCGDCGKAARTTSKFHSCVLSSHTGYQCSLCFYKTSRHKDFNHHLAQEHPDFKQFKCDLCEYASKHRNDVTRHRLNHLVDKPHKCTVCSYQTVRKRELRIHMRTHTGEKPYKCTVCPQAFACTGNLCAHMRIHSRERPYKCTYCDYTSAQPSAIKPHIRMKHTHDKPFKCKYCDYCAVTSSGMTIHTRIHTGEKPYKCSMCDQRTRTSSALYCHIRKHHGNGQDEAASVGEQQMAVVMHSVIIKGEVVSPDLSTEPIKTSPVFLIENGSIPRSTHLQLEASVQEAIINGSSHSQLGLQQCDSFDGKAISVGTQLTYDLHEHPQTSVTIKGNELVTLSSHTYRQPYELLQASLIGNETNPIAVEQQQHLIRTGNEAASASELSNNAVTTLPTYHNLPAFDDSGFTTIDIADSTK